MYYIFEETQSLIKIPQTPVDIDWKTMGQYQEILERLDKEEVVEEKRIFPETIEALVERAGGYVSLNTLGVIFWEKFKARFYLFHLFGGEYKKYMALDKNGKLLTDKSLRELRRRLETNPHHPDLYHGLENCSLPQGFYCFKHNEGDLQVRILWHAEERKSIYGSVVNDIYVAMVLSGREVHNAESEYVSAFNSFTKKHGPVLDLKNFQLISVSREGVHDV